MTKTFEELFGFKTCYDHIVFEIEKLGSDPIRLLGEYTLRDKQDKFFNSTMIAALYQYIEDKDIKWDCK